MAGIHGAAIDTLARLVLKALGFDARKGDRGEEPEKWTEEAFSHWFARYHHVYAPVALEGGGLGAAPPTAGLGDGSPGSALDLRAAAVGCFPRRPHACPPDLDLA